LVTDQGEPPDGPETGPDAVKASLKQRKRVGKLEVIEGGRVQAKPKRTRKPKASAEPPKDDAEEGFDPSAVAGARGDRSPEPPDDDDFGEDDGALPNDDDDELATPDGLDPAIVETARWCADRDQNDRGNAQRLTAWYGSDMAYVSGLGWLTWRGTHWERDEGDLQARLLAQNIVDRIKLEPLFIVPTGPQQRLLDIAARFRDIPTEQLTGAQQAAIMNAAEVRKALSTRRSKRKAWAVTSGNAGRTTAMLVQATSTKAIDSTTLDADHFLFNVRNGTLRFRRLPDLEQDMDAPDAVPRYVSEMAFQGHDRNDLMTKIADVDYDEAATCPKFKAFLDRMQPVERMQTFLQVSTAYSLLTGGNGAQKVFYHFGLGANGKSAFLETIGRLAGSYRTTVSPDTITGDTQRQGQQASPDIARLFNTRFVLVEELPKNTPLREDLVKAFSGGGKLTARFLQKEVFEFQPIFVAVLSGNTKPSITGSDRGIWRRVLIVHWSQTIAEDDPTRLELPELLAMFDAERSGILNWLVEGALLYLKHGLMHFVPPEVKSFTEAYRRDRDNVEVFCEAMILKVKGSKVQAGVLYKNYQTWCEANGLRPASQRSFGDRLGELGYEKHSGRLYEYLDIDLRDAGAPDLPERDPADPGWMP
jgi:putative DNA primase/helicase